LRQIVAITIAAGLLVGTASNALASPIEYIVNGNFDSAVTSNGTGGGWTSSNIDFAGGWRSGGGLLGAGDGMFILNDNGRLVSDPTIQQDVLGLTAGTTYQLTGFFANVYNCCGSRGPATFAVDIDGVNVAKYDYPGAGVWGSFLLNLVAADSHMLVALRAEINGDDTEYKIDGISLTEAGPAAVPEPATLLLVASGGAALLRRRRLSRTQQP
jgi:hypothetical protein